MKTKNSVGALHPILFFAVVYVVALLLSVFICSSLFYSLNGGSSKIGNQQVIELDKQATAAVASTTITMR